jgi:hypothetical protein
MSTYNGWTIVTMPSSPSVKLIEFSLNQVISASVSPFTGQQQVQDWQARFLEASLQLPPLTQAQASAWMAFLVACRGIACVFQLQPFLVSLFPSGLAPGGYWRLKSNQNKWSVTPAIIYGMQFEIREAI